MSQLRRQAIASTLRRTPSTRIGILTNSSGTRSHSTFCSRMLATAVRAPREYPNSKPNTIEGSVQTSPSMYISKNRKLLVKLPQRLQEALKDKRVSEEAATSLNASASVARRTYGALSEESLQTLSLVVHYSPIDLILREMDWQGAHLSGAATRMIGHAGKPIPKEWVTACVSDIYLMLAAAIVVHEFKLPSSWIGKDFATFAEKHLDEACLRFTRQYKAVEETEKGPGTREAETDNEGDEGNPQHSQVPPQDTSAPKYKWTGWVPTFGSDADSYPGYSKYGKILGQAISYMVQHGVEYLKLDNGREWLIIKRVLRRNPSLRFEISPVFEHDAAECNWNWITLALAKQAQEKPFPDFKGEPFQGPWGETSLKAAVLKRTDADQLGSNLLPSN